MARFMSKSLPSTSRRHPRGGRLMAAVCVCCWATAARAVDPDDPIPAPITMDGTTVHLKDFVQAPFSGGPARINYLFHANDGTGRLFFNDMRGKIYVIKDGELQSKAFLNLAGVRGSAFTSTISGETGVTTFAFHPDYSNVGRPGYGKFYTANSETTDSGTPDFDIPAGASTVTHHDVISEWTVDPGNPDEILTSSRREILRIAQPLRDHTVNQLNFDYTLPSSDPEYGLLYIGMGDGGNTGGASVDKWRTAQNTGNVFGTILRIDPFGTNGVNGEYGIPPSNPFVGAGDPLDEIWAYGFRNPQRFSWDTGGTHKMLIADIGQAKIEEVNLGMSGFNYGWSEREGTWVVDHSNQSNLFDLPPDDDSFGYTYPVAMYDHDEGNAITGGFVYRGSVFPALQGKYLFGDLVKGRIFYANESDLALGDSNTTVHEVTLMHDGQQTTLLQLVDAGRVDMRFGQGENGELFVSSKQNGMIYRIAPETEAELGATPLSFTVFTDVGINPPDGNLSVTNIDQSVLNYSIATDQPWLSVTPSSGDLVASETDVLTVSIDVSGLADGAYSGGISITGNAWNTPKRIPVQLTLLTVEADIDEDGDVDLSDFGELQRCLGEAGTPPEAECEDADVDRDNDVDQSDVTVFMDCLSGANVPYDPTCDN